MSGFAMKMDRTNIFICVLFFLYFWDVAYFVGIRNPFRLPHPFLLFRGLGDVEFLRGFPAMLREVIFLFGCGSLIGVSLGALALYSLRLTEGISGILRIALWFPLIIGFGIYAPFILGLMSVSLCACYYYIGGRSVLGLKPWNAWTYATREALLQALLASLIGQLWVLHWPWYSFTVRMEAGSGFGVFFTLAILIAFVNWSFRSSFEVISERHAALQRHEFDRLSRNHIYGFALAAIAFFVMWQVLSALGLMLITPYRVLSVGYELFWSGEIWNDLGASLLEILGGVILGGLAAQGVFLLFSKAYPGEVFSFLLPTTYISAGVLWLMTFLFATNWFGTSFFYIWHKVIAVGCFTFYLMFEALWAFRDRLLFSRILLAVDHVLSIGFVAMALGEAYASTAGLGFAMTVARATRHDEKAIAVALIAIALLVALSFFLRWTAKHLCVLAKEPQSAPV